MSRQRLVIFDVDGTLVDSQNHIVAAMNFAFETCGHVAPPRDATLSIVGLSLAEAMERLMPDLPSAARLRLVDGYKSGFSQIRAHSHSPLYPGAGEALRALHAQDGMHLGIATGKSRRGLDRILAAHDLAHYFVTTQVADDHPSKPHPSMIRSALAETGISPGDVVMIGDTTFDVEMGIAAGIRTIGVTWGYHPAEALRTAGASEIVDDYDALTEALHMNRVNT